MHFAFLIDIVDNIITYSPYYVTITILTITMILQYRCHVVKTETTWPLYFTAIGWSTGDSLWTLRIKGNEGVISRETELRITLKIGYIPFGFVYLRGFRIYFSKIIKKNEKKTLTELNRYFLGNTIISILFY